MDLKQLRYFVVTADEGNMGRAAKRLFVVQSALSRQIQQLEREIGAPVFRRVHSGVQLTPVGEVFLAHARIVLGSADDALQAARSAAHGQRGRLRVAPPEYGERTRQIAAALERFRGGHPAVNLELVPVPWVEHAEALRQGLIDVGFAVATSAAAYPEEIRAETIAPESLRSALLPADHTLTQSPALSLAELAALPMVLSDRSAIPTLYDSILEAVTRAGAEPTIVPGPSSFSGIAQLVAAGAGWVPVLDSVGDAPPAGTVLRRVVDLDAQLEAHVLVRHGAAETLAVAFTQCVRCMAGVGEPSRAAGPLRPAYSSRNDSIGSTLDARRAGT